MARGARGAIGLAAIRVLVVSMAVVGHVSTLRGSCNQVASVARAMDMTGCERGERSTPHQLPSRSHDSKGSPECSLSASCVGIVAARQHSTPRTTAPTEVPVWRRAMPAIGVQAPEPPPPRG